MWDRAADSVLSFLSTYTIHSSILFAAAWLLTRALGSARLGLQAALWRTALLGALGTAPIQLALGTAPVSVQWQGAEASPAALSSLAARFAAARPAASLPPDATVSEPPRREVGPASLPPLDTAPSDRSAVRWTTALPVLWGAGGLLGLVSFGGSLLALRHRLGARRPVLEGWMAQLVSRLSRRAGFRRVVSLTECSTIRVPIALGVWRPEICLPAWVRSSLGRDEHEGLIAHELAHLVRRDPLWLLVAQTVQRLFFFQPLHILARRRMQELSDLRADDWAVRHTGATDGLVACLVRVAEHVVVPGEAAVVSAAAASPSSLRRRILRLLRRENERIEGSRLAALCLIATLVTSVGVAAPAVTLSAMFEEPPSEKAPVPPSEPRVPKALAPAKPAAPAPAPKPAAAAPAPAPKPAAAPVAPAPASQAAAVPPPAPVPAPSVAQPPAPPVPPRPAKPARTAGTSSEDDSELAGRLAEELARIHDLSTGTREEWEALAREAKRMAEAARPSAEEIAKLKEEAMRAAAGAKLSSDEIATLRAEALREARAARGQARKLAAETHEAQRAREAEIQALREQVRKLAREVERLTRELQRSATSGQK
jgi:beta-lactamase regulating signal transducer with metallopeptidase domain